jgi:MYXO-CTERM domain-containing protein
MCKLLVGVLACAGLATSAFANPITPGTAGDEQRSLVIDLNGGIIDGDQFPAVDTLVYDNWTNPGSGLRALFRTGGTEIADDLNMTAGGKLGSCGVNIANQGAEAWANMTGAAGTIRFYRQSNGAFLGGFNFTAPALGAVAVGGSTRLSFGDGALAGLNIVLHEPTIFMSVQYTAITGTYASGGAIALGDVGMQLRGPINLGTSADSMFSFGPTPAPGFFNFGGNPLANGGLKVSLVPAPGALGLLGLGGLVTLRRRR